MKQPLIDTGARRVVEQERGRLFGALGVTAWTSSIPRGYPRAGERVIPDTTIIIEGSRDCSEHYEIRDGGRTVLVAVTFGRIVGSDGAVGSAKTLLVRIASTGAEVRWTVGEDFGAFVQRIASAIGMTG